MERQSPRLLRALHGNMQRAGFANPEELAREASLSVTVVSDIFSGAEPHPRDSHLSRIAFAFAVRLSRDNKSIITLRNSLRDSFKKLRDEDNHDRLKN